MEVYEGGAGGSWFICFRTFEFTTNVLLLGICFKNIKQRNFMKIMLSFQCEVGTVLHEQLLL